MSSASKVRIFTVEDLRFPGEGSSTQCKSGPKARPKGVVDGKSVNIPILVYNAMEGRSRLCQPGVGCPGERM